MPKKSDVDADQQFVTRDAYVASVFNSVLGHDLRNPLSVVAMGAQMLKATANSDAKERTLRIAGRIENSAERLGRMIGDLLSFSNMVNAGESYEKRLKTDLEEVATQATVHLDQNTSFVHCEIQSSGECTGFWDREQMEAAFRRLVLHVKNDNVPECKMKIRLDGCNDDHVSLTIFNGALLKTEALSDDQLPSWVDLRNAQHSFDISVHVAYELVRLNGGTLHANALPKLGTAFRLLLQRNIRR